MSKILPLLALLLSVVWLSYVGAQTPRRWKKCPRACQCFHATAVKGLDVDCSNRKLTDLPTLPKNTITLVMSDNQLLEVLPRSFTRTKRILNIFLYRNQIRRVHWHAFQGLKNLQTLSLFDNQITQINNETFKDLSSVKKIFLYRNQIQSLNKQSFVGLSSLQLLSLRDNKIDSIEPGTFAHVGKLESLFLFRNNLTRLTNGLFQGLTSLKVLIIGFNRIREIENEAFKGLSSLTELYLDNNDLERVTSRMFADLTSLRKLHIYNNNIKTIDPGSFFRLQHLTFIWAHNNKINHVTRGSFAGLRSLRVLHLQANEIEHIDSKSFVDLRELRTLYLYQNKINLISKDAFLGLENLIDLHLGFNAISEIEDQAFQELNKLTTLYLDSNKLTRISKSTFAGLKSLLDLYLYFNQISYVANKAFMENILLRYIAWEPPRSLRQQEKYKGISGNLLFCDCHTMYFKRWLSKHPAIEVTCYGPQKLGGASLKALTKAHLEECYDPQVQASPASATVKVGGTVNLYCSGTPAVEFIWYTNGSRIENTANSHVSSFGTLSLSKIKQYDAGMYICAAKNKKSFAIATVSLNVGYKPYFTSSPQSSEVYEGSKIILPCKVVSEPPPKISWKKYDNAVPFDDERIFQTFEGTLVIMEVIVSDEGVYSCIAENELGIIKKEVQVLVKHAVKEVNEERTIKCPNTATKTTEGIDVISGSGSGDDDDEGDDGSASGDIDERSPSNHTLPSSVMPTSVPYSVPASQYP